MNSRIYGLTVITTEHVCLEKSRKLSSSTFWDFEKDLTMLLTVRSSKYYDFCLLSHSANLVMSASVSPFLMLSSY
ncbi:hypothetical protein SAMN03159341_102119 [Paenibacillus sp. 1_12]|nr:hypothetical protein SAMN03159341_102119 [Paenibacillus sp. 1_12]